jgi:hypothetical protein
MKPWPRPARRHVNRLSLMTLSLVALAVSGWRRCSSCAGRTATAAALCGVPAPLGKYFVDEL